MELKATFRMVSPKNKYGLKKLWRKHISRFIIHQIFKTASIYFKFSIKNPNIVKLFEDGIKRFILNGISGTQILLVTFEKTSTEF